MSVPFHGECNAAVAVGVASNSGHSARYYRETKQGNITITSAILAVAAFSGASSHRSHFAEQACQPGKKA